MPKLAMVTCIAAVTNFTSANYVTMTTRCY